MRELDDDNLDTLLREHFATELDKELDKARSRELDRAPAVLARSSRRLPWRATWGERSRARAAWWAVGPLAAAAAVAAIFLLPALLSRTDRDRGSGGQSVVLRPAISDPAVEHEIRWNTIDQGTVFVNGDTPMRSFRRQRLDNVRWVDPDTNATMQMSVPNDEVVLVGMHAN